MDRSEWRVRRIEQEIGVVKLLIGLFAVLDGSMIGWLATSWDATRWIMWAAIIPAVLLGFAVFGWIGKCYELLSEIDAGATEEK